ncbi:TPA: hypothetical protein I8352_003359 [Citrobacter koseri]|nr:hypothetical protein [Citrobacter koseri]
MTRLKLDLDIGVFNSLMQKKLKTVLVHLPSLPACGSIIIVDVKQGKRTVEIVECTIVFAEHSGLQAHIYNVSLIRGNHQGETCIADTPIGPVKLRTASHNLSKLLAENLEKIAASEREKKVAAMKRKTELLTKKSR